ncbi:MAG: nucleotidyltransferase domain-containing protein [Desulfuromusa sp.]|nr:nucleotidyltransferase domain-containing protein [Desulfuromusa sp.]
MKFGLSDSTITKMQHVFEKYPQIDKVIVYGSRAKGNFRPGSDIDLTLFGKYLTQQQCSEVAEKLDDLLLPYMIDLSVFDLLEHEDLKEHILRVGKVFYQQL